MMSFPKPVGGCVFFAFLFVLTVVAPRARAGKVMLRNGDTISGAIEKLEGGDLTVNTQYAGLIAIDWGVVRRLESEAKFDIDTATGRVYQGTIERTDDKLLIEENGRSREIGILGVSGFTMIVEDAKPTLREKIDIGFNWGYNLTRGNSTLTQSALGTNARYADSKQKLSGIVTSIRSRQNRSETASRHAGDARYDRFINEKMFVYGLGGLERNRQKLLDLRTKLGAGFGLQLVKDATTTVSILGGTNYARENYFPDAMDRTASSDSGEGTAGFEVKAVRLNGIEFTSRLFVFPNLADAGRYRFEYDGSVRLPLFKKFTYGLSFYDRYDSRPAVAVKKNDYGLISALGYTF